MSGVCKKTKIKLTVTRTSGQLNNPFIFVRVEKGDVDDHCSNFSNKCKSCSISVSLSFSHSLHDRVRYVALVLVFTQTTPSIPTIKCKIYRDEYDDEVRVLVWRGIMIL